MISLDSNHERFVPLHQENNIALELIIALSDPARLTSQTTQLWALTAITSCC